MTKDEVIKFAQSRGFMFWATVSGGKKLQFMDNRGINLWVNLADNSFEMGFKVPYSIFNLSCPNCSPFGGEHFDQMYEKFRTTVLLKWGFDL